MLIRTCFIGQIYSGLVHLTNLCLMLMYYMYNTYIYVIYICIILYSLYSQSLGAEGKVNGQFSYRILVIIMVATMH